MRQFCKTLAVGVVGLLLAGLVILPFSTLVIADSTASPQLVISQLKITSSGGQFITLYNATNQTLDMSKFQLEYFNNYDISKSTSSKLIAFSGSLAPHSYFLVNDSSLLLCYQLTVDSQSLGLSSTAGMVEVLAFNQSAPGGSVLPVLQDYVGWSKTAAPGAQTLPAPSGAFLQRQPVDTQNNPLVSSPGLGSWLPVQPDPANLCGLITVVSTGTPTTVNTGLNQLLPGSEPPATIVSLTDDNSASASGPSLPAADIGLMAPVVTEMLPNPPGTGTDASGEFIELYNPNAVDFDLSGFTLQIGTTTTHKFTFPSGSIISAKAFAAYFPDFTGLSASNSGGQGQLLDPFGNSISSADVYGTAKDGEAWALANGSWYWTTKPTPNAANIIEQATITTKSSPSTKTATVNGTKVTAVKGASTSSSSPSTTGNISDVSQLTPIHPWTLAVVAGLAILYGLYEYRVDLANKVHQFRKYRAARRIHR